MPDFSQFYALYPRKIARRYAEQCWRKLTADEQQAAMDALPNHIKLWQAEGREWRLIPHPSTFLNQARWEDELQMPEAPQSQWWSSTEATMAHGRKMGIPARPGEGLDDYRARLRRTA